jgi:hypothetical protein
MVSEGALPEGGVQTQRSVRGDSTTMVSEGGPSDGRGARPQWSRTGAPKGGGLLGGSMVSEGGGGPCGTQPQWSVSEWEGLPTGFSLKTGHRPICLVQQLFWPDNNQF